MAAGNKLEGPRYDQPSAMTPGEVKPRPSSMTPGEIKPDIREALGEELTQDLEAMGIVPEEFTEEAYSTLMSVLKYVFLSGEGDSISILLKGTSSLNRVLFAGKKMEYTTEDFNAHNPT